MSDTNMTRMTTRVNTAEISPPGVGGDGALGAASAFARQVIAIAAKDLRSELRTKQAWSAWDSSRCWSWSSSTSPSTCGWRIGDGRAGALWIAFIFASILGLARNIAVEHDQGPMDRLLLCPVDRRWSIWRRSSAMSSSSA